MQRFALLCSLLLVGFAAFAQDNYLIQDRTYVDNIRTVRWHVAGFPHSFPLVDLNGGAALQLSFDDLNTDIKRYTYQIIHLDMNWERSSLSPLEYNGGFEEAIVQVYDFSFRTLMNYVHYEITLPNEDVRWTKSGNYLLIVYEDENQKRPVITRRFMVVDRRVGINADVVRAVSPGKVQTHQEVDFAVDTENFPVRSPLQTLRGTVLQNGRWDNAVVGIEPNMIRNNNVIFDHQGQVIFGGGNEFRNLDLRSIQSPNTQVSFIGNESDRYSIDLAPDIPRTGMPYLNYADFNGDFVNLRFDRPVLNLSDDYFQNNFNRLQLKYTGDYIDLLFTLKINQPIPDRDVYLFGAFTEWKLKPEYQMAYNPAISAYVGKALIKQGFYNYWYVTTPAGAAAKEARPPVMLDDTERNYIETENDYLILVYYRPFGARYDELIGSYGVSSQ